ncbi:hypothetical protein GGR51DRAFT_503762 [Nemania sp. FL0031]|nr:hypothetical protein GGR51DRAFT_503762 [Nemania sp. FL0031]
MRPLFAHTQLHEAVNNQAIPALEAIAANDNLRSFRRFERDDPPPYVSSTESEELDDADLIQPSQGLSTLDELEARIQKPLSEREIATIAHYMSRTPLPEDIYHTEAHREESRFRDSLPRGRPTPIIFRKLNGIRRQGVIARHLVKRRWEKLGIWNPKWGFAGRQVTPGDNSDKWTWSWGPEGAADDLERKHQDASGLIARALRLRQNLRRGESSPVIPRSHPGPDTTAAEFESFLISRPWFVFEIEVAEEDTRYRRLEPDEQRRYRHSAKGQVIEWWKERGDWKPEFNSTKWVTSWKWRHESPSPEPEDLTRLGNMAEDALTDDLVAEIEFTPSEIDELETIDLPESEQPKGFWVIKQEDDLKPSFPGQMVDMAARASKKFDELEKARAEGSAPPIPPRSPRRQLLFDRLFRGGKGLFNPWPAAEHEEAPPKEREASEGPPEGTSEPQQDAARPPPQRQRRLRQHRSQDEADRVQDQDQPLPLPLRRSARIAAIKRPAEPLPSQTGPNKRTRLRNAVAPTPNPASGIHGTIPRSISTRAPPKKQTETQPRRKRGRPRKEDGPNLYSAVEKKPTRTVTRAGAVTRNARTTKTDTPDVPRRRGRPRKDQ